MLNPGDRIILCSDGLTNMIEDEKIHEIMREQQEAAEAAIKLTEAANRNGGKDNITVIVINPFSR